MGAPGPAAWLLVAIERRPACVAGGVPRSTPGFSDLRALTSLCRRRGSLWAPLAPQPGFWYLKSTGQRVLRGPRSSLASAI